jgi:hypothetical protein
LARAYSANSGGAVGIQTPGVVTGPIGVGRIGGIVGTIGDRRGGGALADRHAGPLGCAVGQRRERRRVGGVDPGLRVGARTFSTLRAAAARRLGRAEGSGAPVSACRV